MSWRRPVSEAHRSGAPHGVVSGRSCGRTPLDPRQDEREAQTGAVEHAATGGDVALAILREALAPLIQNWEQRLNVHLKGYYLRRMTTRWGTCNYRTKHIRLNTELVTKPRHLFEYVLVHEMVHLIVPNHGARFIALMNEHYPAWREARADLNGTAKRQAQAL